ncbi:hypothetical protein TRFO_15497 [Tritrichomonas foetus]|uniref:Uncharacterized protein n=1 Tax=Tritrichomonas foetus TaxID=1144522 RepID=A0A1J4KXC3_9EUKA|nr:hypothetical protein TRFO_15497 [Tritrichomonas foetus]|eukprot:OHT14205.1 hypothetical protein TRFO_15497 [Tritrichomonas foetus]
MSLNLSFSDWPYPTKKPQNQHLAMSPCGLLAHSIDNIITIYVDGKNGYSPLISWAPFDHPVQCMGWYDATEIPDTTIPLLVIGSEQRRLIVFDLVARKNIVEEVLKKESATIIKWSPISSSRFFVGTKNGDVLCCSIKFEDGIQFSMEWMISVDFEVNYLTFEPSFGDTLAVCSKSGQLKFIKRIHSKLPLVQPETYTLCRENNEVYSCEFLESSSNYMIFVTKRGAILYAIAELASITLFNDVKLKDLFPVISHGRRLIGINDEMVALYELVNNKVDRLCEIQLMPSVTNLPYDFSPAYVYKNDRIVYVSWNWWLTTIKIVNNKLFVTSRIRLLHEKPLDFSFRNGGTLLSTVNGSILATRSTPGAVYQNSPSNDVPTITPIGKLGLPKRNSSGQISPRSTTPEPHKTKLNDSQPIKSPLEAPPKPEPSQKNNTLPSMTLNSSNHPKSASPPPKMIHSTFPSLDTPSMTPPVLNPPRMVQPSKSALKTDQNSGNQKLDTVPTFSPILKVGFADPPASESESNKVPLFQNAEMQALTSQTIMNRSRRRISMSLKYSNDDAVQTSAAVTKNVDDGFDTKATEQLNNESGLSDAEIAKQAIMKMKMANNANNESTVPSMTAPNLPLTQRKKRKSENAVLPKIPLSDPSKGKNSEADDINATEQNQPHSSFAQKGKKSQMHAKFVIGDQSDTSASEEQRSYGHSRNENYESCPHFPSLTNSDPNAQSLLVPHRGRSQSLAPTNKDNVSQIATSVRSNFLKSQSQKYQNASSASEQNDGTPKLIGNSRAIAFSIELCDIPLEKVEWIGPTRIFTYGRIVKDQRHITKIFVVDIKTRTIYPILEQRLSTLNMPVTDIIVSNNKKFAVITISNSLVAFISLTTTTPKVTSTLTLNLSTTAKTLVSFDDDGNRVTLVTGNKALILEDLKSPKPRASRPSVIDTKGHFTAVLWKNNSLFIGTEEGKVIFINFEPFGSTEIIQLKNSISSITNLNKNKIMITDSKNYIYIATNQGVEAKFPFPIKRIKPASQKTFVIKKFHAGRISAINIHGNSLLPCFSPSITRCTVMKPREQWSELLSKAVKMNEAPPVQIAEFFGMPLVRSILVNLENPDFTREQMTFIRDILIADPDLNNLALHLCLDIGEIDRAQTLALNTEGTSPNFVLNIFKAILFETNPREEIVQAAIVHLITEGKAQDAIDMLLIIGKLKEAVDKLMSIDELKEAQCILKMRVEESEEMTFYMKEVAARIIESGRLGAGLVLLALSGGIDQVASHFRDLCEIEQAEFIEKMIC